MIEGGLHLSEILIAELDSAFASRPVGGAILRGPPGCGKSAIADWAAERTGSKFIPFQATPGLREEDLLMRVLPDPNTPSGVTLQDGVLVSAAKSSERQKTLLLLDEWEKSRPSCDGLLLDFLQTGRITIPGCAIRAHLRNLIVILTMNDERELSEPLMRRLPVFELEPPSVDLVRLALTDTHESHPQLEAAVALYERSMLVNDRLDRPVTIQELRQLLDAISHLGDMADWDRLVRRFVSKTSENHHWIKVSERMERQKPSHEYDDDRLDSSYYEDEDEYEEEEPEPEPVPVPIPSLPRSPVQVKREWRKRKVIPIPEEGIEKESEEEINGVVKMTNSTYSCIARVVYPGEDPSILGELAEVKGENLILRKSIDLREDKVWEPLLKEEGEIVLTVPPEYSSPDDWRDWEDCYQVADEEKWNCYLWSKSEVLVKAKGTECRWTPDGGWEIISSDMEYCKKLHNQWGTQYNKRRWAKAKHLYDVNKIVDEFISDIDSDDEAKSAVCKSDFKIDSMGHWVNTYLYKYDINPSEFDESDKEKASAQVIIRELSKKFPGFWRENKKEEESPPPIFLEEAWVLALSENLQAHLMKMNKKHRDDPDVFLPNPHFSTRNGWTNIEPSSSDPEKSREYGRAMKWFRNLISEIRKVDLSQYENYISETGDVRFQKIIEGSFSNPLPLEARGSVKPLIEAGKKGLARFCKKEQRRAEEED